MKNVIFAIIMSSSVVLITCCIGITFGSQLEPNFLGRIDHGLYLQRASIIHFWVMFCRRAHRIHCRCNTVVVLPLQKYMYNSSGSSQPQHPPFTCNCPFSIHRSMVGCVYVRERTHTTVGESVYQLQTPPQKFQCQKDRKQLPGTEQQPPCHS